MTGVTMYPLTEHSLDKSPSPAQGEFGGAFSDETSSNPMGTAGFEFVEYTAPDPTLLRQLFEMLGFSPIARHRSKDVTLYSQGGVNFLINGEKENFAQAFAKLHGPSICAMAFRVHDAAHAFERAISLGGKPVESGAGPMELRIPAIEGIGGSLIYFVDRYKNATIYDVDFVPIEGACQTPPGVGFTEIDHLTHNVYRGRLDEWAGFYEKLFNFREIRFFDIEGKQTGLKSRAMTSPCGKIRIPINESADDKSQIHEYLEAYKGEGIQHIALATEDIYSTVDQLLANGVEFMPAPPDTYFHQVDDRLPHHEENIGWLQSRGILIDGAPVQEKGDKAGVLLQIFTQTVVGPIFFEVIQRKGDDGFGEGNFQALFDSIEADQMERGVL